MNSRRGTTVGLVALSALLVVLLVAPGTARRSVLPASDGVSGPDATTAAGPSGQRRHAVGWSYGWERTGDLTATALPGADRRRVRDSAFEVGWNHDREVKVDTTSTGSAGCDRCAARADALQVLYLYGPDAPEVDNVATAWTADCKRCRSSSLSVQVVLASDGSGITANNRALAANVACVRCTARSAAYQLVVLTAERERLSDEEVTQLRTWAVEQRRALRLGTTQGQGGSARSRPEVARASDLGDLVTSAVGGTVAVADVDIRAK